MRVDGDEGTPVPIPNTVVKLMSGDNTWLATAWEDNTMRTQTEKTVPRSYRLFCCHKLLKFTFSVHLADSIAIMNIISYNRKVARKSIDFDSLPSFVTITA